VQNNTDSDAAIKQLFIAKYPGYGNYGIIVQKADATHARGTITLCPGDPCRGGLFLAVKKNNLWQLVFDGIENGDSNFSCNLVAPYDFPGDMISDCVSDKACTQEAKLCPDGSSVSRQGPNCEFAPCPNIDQPLDTSTWSTYNNSQLRIEFKYPDNWPQPKVVNDKGQATDGTKLIWRINIGQLVEKCEGGDCYPYYLYGISTKNYTSTLDNLRKNKDAVANIVEKKVNGNSAILYIEKGMGTTQVAIIFGAKQTFEFVGDSGSNPNNDTFSSEFDAILSSFKTIK